MVRKLKILILLLLVGIGTGRVYLFSTSFSFTILLDPKIEYLKPVLSRMLTEYSPQERYFSYEVLTYEGNSALPKKSLLYFGTNQKIFSFFLKDKVLSDYFYIGAEKKNNLPVFVGFIEFSREYSYLAYRLITVFLGYKYRPVVEKLFQVKKE